MVDKYHTAGEVLYICSEKVWREGEQTLCELSFEVLASTDTTQAFLARDRPLTKDIAAYAYHVAGIMYEMAHRDRECFLEPWQKAINRGGPGGRTVSILLFETDWHASRTS